MSEMNIDQWLDYLSHKFKEEFSETNIPDWQCPHCLKGILKLKTNSLNFTETPKSKKERKHDDWEIEWVHYLYTCTFYCPHCEAETVSCGTGRIQVFHSCQPEDEYYEEVNFFTPTHFQPALQLLEIPEKCSEHVRNTLMGSFSVAWADLPSACNKLRVATEKLVHDLSPSLFKKRSTLHQRIEQLAETHPETANRLMAIKWIGNSASHDDNLQEHDLAFGYKIMGKVLAELYSETDQYLDEQVELVNAAKGSIIKTKN